VKAERGGGHVHRDLVLPCISTGQESRKLGSLGQLNRTRGPQNTHRGSGGPLFPTRSSLDPTCPLKQWARPTTRARQEGRGLGHSDLRRRGRDRVTLRARGQRRGRRTASLSSRLLAGRGHWATVRTPRRVLVTEWTTKLSAETLARHYTVHLPSTTILESLLSRGSEDSIRQAVALMVEST